MDSKQVILIRVNERQMTKRSDNSTFTIYEIETSEGTYRIRKDLVVIARQLEGALVDIVTRTEQRGDYTNYYADYIALAAVQPNPALQATNAALLAQAAQAQQAQAPAQPPYQPPHQQQQFAGATQPPAANTQPQAVQAPTQTEPQGTPREAEERKNLSIHRQTAAKVAATLAATDPNPAVFWENIQSLVAFFQEGRVPSEFAMTRSDLIPVAAGVAGGSQRADEYQHTDADVPGFDDSIPF